MNWMKSYDDFSEKTTLISSKTNEMNEMNEDIDDGIKWKKNKINKHEISWLWMKIWCDFILISMLFLFVCVFEKIKKNENEIWWKIMIFMLKNRNMKMMCGMMIMIWKMKWRRQMMYILCSLCFMMFMNCHVSKFQKHIIFI